MLEREPIPVIFYQEDGSGNEPVKKWLSSLTKEDKRRIGDDLRTVQIGWPLGMPLVRNLGGGLWEMRSHILHGIARIIFMVDVRRDYTASWFCQKNSKTSTGRVRPGKKKGQKVQAR